MTADELYYVAVTGQHQAELLCEPRDATPLKPDEVAGRTLATVISAGTELGYAFAGTKGFPIRTGYAAVFEVEQVGNDVADLKSGDRAYCMGLHQSWQRFPREEVVPVPEGLAPEGAVLARIMGVSMSTLTTTKARPPANVLVTGLGLVGNLASQVFAACGYEVTACDPVTDRCELARRVGLTNVFLAVPFDAPAFRQQVDLVVECSGHEQAVLDGARCVRKGGEVVLVGAPWRRQTAITAHELLSEVFHKYVVLRSGWEWEVPLHPAEFVAGSIFGNFAGALKWLAEGRITTAGLCDTRPPRAIQTAYDDLLHKRGPALSVVLDWIDLP